jgi:hypothetical protein
MLGRNLLMSDKDNWPDLSEEIMADRGRYLNPELFTLDRPRGILSKTDREYLVGKREYEHKQSELNRKQEIRKRVKNGLKDFELLDNYHSIDQREQVLDNTDESKLDHYVISLISYLCKSSGCDIEWLEENIQAGMYKGITTFSGGSLRGDIESVSVDIDIQYVPDIDKIYEKFTNPDAKTLTPGEIGLLVRHGKLSKEDIEELDRSGPGELPAKLERRMEYMQQKAKEMAKEMDGVELIEEDSQNKDKSE